MKFNVLGSNMATRCQNPIKEQIATANCVVAKGVLGQKRQTSGLVISALSIGLLLTGCQPATDPTSEQGAQDEQIELSNTRLIKAGAMSDSAAAVIEEYQPLYVEQMLGLQQRLQAEYESLKSADAANTTTLGSETAPDGGAGSTSATNPTQTAEPLDNSSTTADPNTDAPLDPNAKVGERDLEVLKRISFEPRAPEMLSEEQIVQQYQQAMQALYKSDRLSAEESETLLSIADLLPQLFEHPELAQRLNIKSPTLARFIVQHQIWGQIEAQQAADMQQMKQEQQQEFEALMAKFNETIEGYDEQIAKYERQLEEFQ